MDKDWMFIAAIFPMIYFHLMHLNVLTNMRLKFAQAAPCCCIWFWKPINILICKFDKFRTICRKICVDQCFKLNTILKWILYYIVFYMYITRLQSYMSIIDKYDSEMNWQKLALMRISIDNITWYVWVFILHHWIFIACRIALFFFIQLFCCGCQCI